LTDPVDGFLRGTKYLIHDRDPLFAGIFACPDHVVQNVFKVERLTQ